MNKVTGIGGIFFKSQNPGEMRNWYAKHLGMKMDDYGCLFEFGNNEKPHKKRILAVESFSKDTEYFAPSKAEFMINYRVNDLENLLEELRKNGVEVVGEIQSFEYGKFAHVLDLEGNKIELWEPIDQAFTETNTDK